MNIKVYGFRLLKKHLPPAYSPADAFKVIKANRGKPLDSQGYLRIAATPTRWKHDGNFEEWWAGLLLRVRDAASFNRLESRGGKLELESLDLQGGRIADLSYFIAHGETGNGLIASYYQGPGFTSLKFCMKRLFRQKKSFEYKAAIEDAKERGADKRELAGITDHFRGSLLLSYLDRGDNLKGLMKDFRSVNSFEAHLSSVEEQLSIFQKLKAKACGESVRLKFPPEFVLTDELAHEILSELAADDEMKATIKGKGADGKPTSISSDTLKNRFIFAEKDYDEMLGRLKLDLNDWDASILRSPLVAWLKHEAFKPEYRVKLTS